jgi:endonuclease/exonuclease/phosphatase family metal-dependent hydrolase
MKLKHLISLIIGLLFVTGQSQNRNAIAAKNPTKTDAAFTNSNFKSSNNNEKLKIATWNIRDLGRTKNSEEIFQIAGIIKDNDIVAIQEVVAKDPAGAQAVAKIADELNRMGNKWDYSISDPTKGSSAHKSERYAFLWKTNKVKLVQKPFLDKELELLVTREPYIAEFKLKKGSESFFIINFHSRKYYDNPEEEIVFFEKYPKSLNSEKIFILGDFNINERHYVWEMLYRIGFKPALRNTPTTLKTKCKDGKYMNYAIDNIFYATPGINKIRSGRIDFVDGCKNLTNARLISDHLPVFMECTLN